MPDAKFGVVHFWLDVKCVGFVCVVQLFEQALVSALGETTLLVQKIENTKFLDVIYQIRLELYQRQLHTVKYILNYVRRSQITRHVVQRTKV